MTFARITLGLILCCFIALSRGRDYVKIAMSQYSNVKKINIVRTLYEDSSNNTVDLFYWTLPDGSTLKPGDNKSTDGYLASPPKENDFGGINKTFELELPGEFIDNTLFSFSASGPVRPDSNFKMWEVTQDYTVHCDCISIKRPELKRTTFYTEDGSARIQIHLIGGVPKERVVLWKLPNGDNLELGHAKGPYTALSKAELSDGSRLYTLVVAPEALLPNERLGLWIHAYFWDWTYEGVLLPTDEGRTTPNKASYRNPRISNILRNQTIPNKASFHNQTSTLLTAALLFLSVSSLTLF